MHSAPGDSLLRKGGVFVAASFELHEGATALSRDSRDPAKGTGRSPAVEDDPLHAAFVSSLQVGNWADAAAALAGLEKRYPDSPTVRRLRFLLSLKLSAEETWRGRGDAARWPLMLTRVIRVLLVADVAVIILLTAMWLLLYFLGVSY